MSKTLELPSQDWPKFLAETQKNARRVDIHLTQPDGRVIEIATQTPLRRILWQEHAGQCAAGLLVEFGESNEKDRQHLIIDPTRLWLDDRVGDEFRLARIFAENGTTDLKFHPPLAITNLL